MSKNLPLTDEEFKYIYSRVPRLCVDVVIKTQEGVLLTQRNIAPYKDLWHIPGGTVYYRETIEAAVKRIAKEELGVDVVVGGLYDFIENYDESESRGGWGWPIALQLKCSIKFGELCPDKQLAKEARFFKKAEDIPKNTIDSQKKFLINLLNT